MRSQVISAALAGAFVVSPVAAGYASARAQAADFSITNQEPVAKTPFRRELMRRLQAWWDVHAYYPKHASNNDEGGTVTLHLRILPDGAIWMVTPVESSGSRALDLAAASAFRNANVQRFPEGEPEVDLDLALHYVLAHRHAEPVAAGYKSASSRSAFTITNDPVTSVILETMLQKTCSGTLVSGGSRSRAWQGRQSSVELVFFRRSDGTPWVKFYEKGQSTSLSPVTEIGNMLEFVGPQEQTPRGYYFWRTWTVWPDGPNHLSGAEGSPIQNPLGVTPTYGMGGPVDLTCATEAVPAVPFSSASAQIQVPPPGDPP